MDADNSLFHTVRYPLETPEEPDETISRYRFLADVMPLLVWTARPDGFIDYFNQRWYDTTGLEPPETQERHWQSVLHPDDLSLYRDSWTQALQTGKPYELECRFRRASDGSHRWHLVRAFPRRNSNGKIVQWVGTGTDIDDQVRVQEELEAGRRFALSALDGLAAHIAVLDEAGRIIMVNRSWRAFAEANGPTINPASEGANYLHVCDSAEGDRSSEAPLVAQGIRAVLRGEQDKFVIEYPCHSDTELRWFNLRVTRFPDPGPARVIVSHEDITSRKLAEEALRRRALELARATRALERTNRELDQFAYITSHDLKAPLRGIANLSSWIEEDLGDNLNPETQQHLELLRGRVNRMEAMIEGILQYSRIGRVQSSAETVDVGVLLNEVIDLMAPPPEVHIKIETPMPPLLTDKLRLQQVFMNLIGNAIKHAQRPDVEIRIAAREQGDFQEFVVSDNGPGIAPQYHEKIFQFFQTLEARDKVEGTGIGLSLVKKIIENLGGTIQVESEEGKGAAFRFTLPKSSETE
jgi:PAS domain S-box-containing protein